MANSTVCSWREETWARSAQPVPFLSLANPVPCDRARGIQRGRRLVARRSHQELPDKNLLPRFGARRSMNRNGKSSAQEQCKFLLTGLTFTARRREQRGTSFQLVRTTRWASLL